MFTEISLPYWRPCRSTRSIEIRRRLEFETLEERQLLSPQIFLTPTVLAGLQQEAIANTPQWQAFKARLDASLPIALGAYEASDLRWISDYALGYQVLQTIDPVTAANYADKAIALIKSALFDYQNDQTVNYQFLVRGNGSTTTFTLPNTAIIPSSVQVFLSPVTTQAIIHGSLNGQDEIGFSQKILKISNTPDGNPDYLEGVDWFRNPNLAQNLIDWSLPGKEPLSGATYYVTSTTGESANPTHFTLSGNTITLPTAPTASQAVYVSYVYGVHAANGSSLAYQQTSAGDGGFNSIFVGDSYTSRYLGKHVAMGLDWLDGYVGLSANLRSQIIAMLVKWFNYVQSQPVLTGEVTNNYRAGAYCSQVMTAIALQNRDPSGPALISQALTDRQQAVADMQGPLSGGFYNEGWSYGALATENILESGLALESAGVISTAATERAWASQVIRALISAQPSAATVYDGGDWYVFPALLPDNMLFDVLSFAADDPAARSYANYVIQSRLNQKIRYPWVDLLFRNPSATASFWPSFPMQYLADGTGLITARADWSYGSTWLAFKLGNPQQAGHQDASPGQLQIQRGADDLLVNANSAGGNQDIHTKSSFSNLIAINDNGAGLQTYPWNMGFSYGSPGVFISNYEATANYFYFGGDYSAAYSNPSYPGAGGPATQLTRQVVYLRPNFVIVHDRAGTVLAGFPKELRWHFLNAPHLAGNSWAETVGSSTLFGETFSTVPLTTASYSVVDAGATVYRVATDNASPVLNVQYTTALETAPSSVTSMVGTQQVVSTDGSMEGVLMGNDLVLFGKMGPLSPSAGPVTYSINSSGSVFNLLTDLQPNATYTIQVNGGPVTTLTSSAQGTLSFSTPAGANRIIVTGLVLSNPVPVISGVSQTSAMEGTNGLGLLVNGTGLAANSVVQWNGTALATIYVSTTQVRAVVPASDLAEEGTANITVVNPAPGGGTSAAIAFSINDAVLTAAAVVVGAKQGVPFSGPVATFTDANPTAPLSDFTTGSGGARIDWGDGTVTTGTITQPGGAGTEFVVSGSHTYLTAGPATIKVTITDKGSRVVQTTSVTSALGNDDIAGRDPHTGQWWVGTSTGTSFSTSQWGSWNPAVNWVDVLTGDFNGDGKTDIAGRDSRTGQWFVSLSNGSNGFTTTQWAAWNPTVSWVNVQVGDFTGDGKSDIIGRVLQSGQWWVAVSNGTSFTTTLWATWSPAVTWVDVKVGDFNGDGKDDITGRDLYSGNWWTGLSTGTSFTTSWWATWSPAVTWVDVQVGDFNGDGKKDITGRVSQSGQWWTAISTGSSFSTTLWCTWSPAVTWVNVKVGDFTGDGKDDIIGRVLLSGDWWLGRSNGTTFTNSWWGNWNPAVTWVDVQVGDFNGDGKDDITGRNSRTGDWWTALSTGTSLSTTLWATWSPTINWSDVHTGAFI